MKHPYEKLLEPLWLTPNVVLKNRILFPRALPSFFQGPELHPAEPLIHAVAEYCRNGAATMTFRHEEVDDYRRIPRHVDMSHVNAFDYNNPANDNYMCQVADMAHFYGSKILIAVSPKFPEGYSYGGGMIRKPNSTGMQIRPAKPPFPAERMHEIYDQIIDMLTLYKKWGFDGMNFRCDFLLQADNNVREDEYGGPIENRGRVMYELFGEVKKSLGKDFIIEAVLPGEQPNGYQGTMLNGYTREEAVRFARLIDDRIDLLQVRAKDMCLAHPTGYTHNEHVYDMMEYCRDFKAAGIKTSIVANGGFQHPDDMEKIIESGACDAFACGRAFFADSDFGKKIHEGKGDEIVPCIQCNKCHGTLTEPWLSFCTVNPRQGIDHRIPSLIKPPRRTKKVAIIGGGPIGMRTAIFASQRGHQVTIFEQSDYLGGQLRHADTYPFKWPLKKYRQWLIDEIGRHQIEVRLNTKPVPERITAEGFDAVIAATGAIATLPNISGMHKEDGSAADGIYTCAQVYRQEVEVGENVVMVGGSEVGMETAMYLARTGHEVTVLTRQKEVGHDCSKLHYVTISHVEIDPQTGWGNMVPDWHKDKDHLVGITEAKTLSVAPNSVAYIKDGITTTLTCDTVIVSGGIVKQIANALEYEHCTPEFYMVGDIESNCSNIQQGNRSALGKASLL